MHSCPDYEAYCRGDDEGLARIIRDHSDGLILFLRTFCNDIHDAENLAEDVFVKIAVKKPHYNGKASFKTWLYTIGRNMAIDKLRKKNAEWVPLDACAQLSADERSLEEEFIRQEEKIAVHRAMQALPPDYQQILWLVYFEGYQVKEAAQIMGKSTHAAEALISRARQKMKEILGDQRIEKL